jgi:hypothetical protein
MRILLGCLIVCLLLPSHFLCNTKQHKCYLWNIQLQNLLNFFKFILRIPHIIVATMVYNIGKKSNNFSSRGKVCVCVLFIILQDAKIEQFCYSLDHIILLCKKWSIYLCRSDGIIWVCFSITWIGENQKHIFQVLPIYVQCANY